MTEPKTPPRNVDDVSYAELDEKRPMREVLKDRRRQAAGNPTKLRYEAFRERAFTQAQLVSCLCCYPLVLSDTDSQHESWCPAHHLLLSRIRQEKIDRDRIR